MATKATRIWPGTNNLAHCFTCQKNTSNIDLLRTQGYDFLAAVALLERWLRQYQAQQAKTKKPPTAPTVD